MFTGIITEKGTVLALKQTQSGAVLSVKAPVAASGASIGDSIAIEGACLTVVSISGDSLSFDLSAETLKCTTLNRLAPQGKVNIEPALKADSKLGGHFVSGHVDTVGTIKSRANEGQTERFVIQATRGFASQLVPKGSVAVDGISLTVVDVFEDSFSLVIIPHTLKITTLGDKRPGDVVNLESDIIGKYVFRYLDKTYHPSSSLFSALEKHGFMGK